MRCFPSNFRGCFSTSSKKKYIENNHWYLFIATFPNLFHMRVIAKVIIVIGFIIDFNLFPLFSNVLKLDV